MDALEMLRSVTNALSRISSASVARCIFGEMVPFTVGERIQITPDVAKQAGIIEPHLSEFQVVVTRFYASTELVTPYTGNNPMYLRVLGGPGIIPPPSAAKIWGRGGIFSLEGWVEARSGRELIIEPGNMQGFKVGPAGTLFVISVTL